MVVTEDSEWLLISQCRRGRTAAFEPLVLRYQGEATAMAEAMLLDRDDAADVVQDAFVRAYRGLGRLADGSAFGPWFRTIVRNLCLDHLRSNSRYKWEHLDDAREEALAVYPVGTGRIEQQQLGQSIWNALRTLSAAHRQILVLKELEGLSYADIAAALGISEGTVASRVFHARAALKRALVTEGIDSMGSIR